MSVLFLPTSKCFQVLQCITNNSNKHQSFVYAQLNDQTVLFLTIQFNNSYVFIQFPFDPYIGPHQVLILRAVVNRGAMAMKGYLTFPTFPTLLEPHH